MAGLPKDPGRDLSQPLTEVRYVVPVTEDGERLDRFLAARLVWRSRTGIQKLIRDGLVRLGNGEALKRRAQRLREGDEVVLEVPAPITPTTQRASLDDVRIVHEDRWLLLVDKPALLTVHPAGRHQRNTLIHLLHKRYRVPDDPTQDVVPKLVHRLDRETSGLLLITKDDNVRHHLGVQFEKRAVEKHYLALVNGHVEEERGVIDLPLSPARRSKIRLKMEARTDDAGLKSRTEYEVLERRPHTTLLALHPLTGRQHQLRVHLASKGYPIVGDKIYGPDEEFFLRALDGTLSRDDERILGMPRHALHSWRLRFHHPVLDEMVEYEAELPEDMRSYLEHGPTESGEPHA